MSLWIVKYLDLNWSLIELRLPSITYNWINGFFVGHTHLTQKKTTFAFAPHVSSLTGRFFSDEVRPGWTNRGKVILHFARLLPGTFAAPMSQGFSSKGLETPTVGYGCPRFHGVSDTFSTKCVWIPAVEREGSMTSSIFSTSLLIFFDKKWEMKNT